MTWRTHAVIGANAIWITVFANKVNAAVFAYIPVAIIASLLPDIDAIRAKIHYVAGGVLYPLQGIFRGKYFHHRGLMHSLFITVLFGGVVAFFSRNTYVNLMPLVFMAAYFSHPVIDGFNTGVGYLFPMSLKKFALVPKSLRTPVGGIADNLLFFIGAFGLILFFYVFRNQFVGV